MTDLLAGGPTVLLGLLLAAFTAGWVDAVVGGGGLIQLPALLLGLPGASPAQVLATNKMASICGTTTAATTYYRRVRPDLRTAVPLAVAAFAGSAGGAVVATRIPKEAFTPIILAALVVVGAYTVLKPDLGSAESLRWAGRRHLTAAVLLGVLVGFYDGALGPGTGSFLVFGLVGLVGYGFLQASAQAKIANVATNCAALLVFAPHLGAVWPLGLAMGAANVAGGYLGARTAVARGAGFVRAVFLVVVGGFVVRLGGQVLHWW